MSFKSQPVLNCNGMSCSRFSLSLFNSQTILIFSTLTCNISVWLEYVNVITFGWNVLNPLVCSC